LSVLNLVSDFVKCNHPIRRTYFWQPSVADDVERKATEVRNEGARGRSRAERTTRTHFQDQIAEERENMKRVGRRTAAKKESTVQMRQ
jgi:hypothetical protein